MIARTTRAVPDLEQKKQLLQTIYNVYAGWIQRFPLKCRMGCSACCTQSVTISSLEGLAILEFIEKNNRNNRLSEKLALAEPVKGMAPLTMNQFAEACLKQRETEEDSAGSWNFSPCVFLEDDICTIYPVRPFGCRSFGSLELCADTGAAQMAPIHITVNTVFTQLIEHLSSDGGYWSNMANILKIVLGDKDRADSKNLPAARTIPGFLLEPHEVGAVRALLLQLKEHSEEKRTFGDLIDNFMPME